MKKDTVLATLLKQSDGCSFAPDKNFYSCCATHDAYYRMDLGVSRFMADVDLLICIHKKNHTWLALVYFVAVRVFGSSFFKGYKQDA